MTYFSNKLIYRLNPNFSENSASNEACHAFKDLTARVKYDSYKDLYDFNFLFYKENKTNDLSEIHYYFFVCDGEKIICDSCRLTESSSIQRIAREVFQFKTKDEIGLSLYLDYDEYLRRMYLQFGKSTGSTLLTENIEQQQPETLNRIFELAEEVRDLSSNLRQCHIDFSNLRNLISQLTSENRWLKRCVFIIFILVLFMTFKGWV